ncbi:gluconeogenesis factor YvcK family protein [Brevibacillus panacihumi]|uniref:Gluconeogenesis factor n=1 Tax=Brevibacillus panacihumi TaxID=497735 RepID=A0A3M8CGS3_9BACL|nr:YvcK family protein [Brevibacillus panacihumi]RNB74703.1 YvcK family protein [Brevibacillus panacihumi]
MPTKGMGRPQRKEMRIVVIGGGTGLSVLLRGLKYEPVHITAIVTVADDGGSSGRLRAEMDMPPPGDIRNVLTALADTEPLMEKVMQYRFSAGTGLAGHNLGNLLLAAMNEITGDFVTAVKALSGVLAVRGDVLPASTQSIQLVAEMTDGALVAGESQIPLAGKKIKRVFLEPADAAPLNEALLAIADADAILIGPGSLYTSIIPNLLVRGLFSAVSRSTAPKIYICNVMTQPGETDGFAASHHVHAMYQHVGEAFLDTIIVNSAKLPLHVLEKYAEKGAKPVRCDLKQLRQLGLQIVAKPLVTFEDGYLRHDAHAVSRQVVSLLKRRRRS